MTDRVEHVLSRAAYDLWLHALHFSSDPGFVAQSVFVQCDTAYLDSWAAKVTRMFGPF